MSDFPEDMAEDTRKQLIYDRRMFGNCFYEETEDGYRRLDPREAY